MDPTSSFQHKMKSLLTLHKSGHFSGYHYHKLRDSVGRIHLLYALPQIHKPDVPLWPVVSFVFIFTLKTPVSILSPPHVVGSSEHHIVVICYSYSMYVFQIQFYFSYYSILLLLMRFIVVYCI